MTDEWPTEWRNGESCCGLACGRQNEWSCWKLDKSKAPLRRWWVIFQLDSSDDALMNGNGMRHVYTHCEVINYKFPLEIYFHFFLSCLTIATWKLYAAVGLLTHSVVANADDLIVASSDMCVIVMLIPMMKMIMMKRDIWKW